LGTKPGVFDRSSSRKIDSLVGEFQRIPIHRFRRLRFFARFPARRAWRKLKQGL